MKPSEELKAYIEAEIIPRYVAFDAAHRTDHVRTVIAQSLVLAGHYEVDADMVYAIAAYHDTGLAYGRESHHIRSGEILLGDSFMRQWFTEEQMAVMRDAIEDHRGLVRPRPAHDLRTDRSRGRPLPRPRNRNPPHDTIRARAHYPALSREGQFDRCVEHLQRKYAEGGYLRLWIPESDNARKLAELRELIRNTARLHETFGRIYGEVCRD